MNPSIPEAADLDALFVTFVRLGRFARASAGAMVTPSQQSVLLAVAHHGRLTIGELAEREYVRPPSVSKLVNDLVEAGLLTREVEPADRRYVTVSLSSAGLDIVELMRSEARDFLAFKLAEISAADVAALVAVLPVLDNLLATSPRRNERVRAEVNGPTSSTEPKDR